MTSQTPNGTEPQPGAYLTGVIRQESGGSGAIALSVSADGSAIDAMELDWVNWVVSLSPPGSPVSERLVRNGGGGVLIFPSEGIPITDGYFSYSEALPVDWEGVTAVEGWFTSPTEAEVTLTIVWSGADDVGTTQTYSWRASGDPDKPRPGLWEWGNVDEQDEKMVRVGDWIAIRLALGSPDTYYRIEWLVEGPEGVLRQASSGLIRISSEAVADFEPTAAGKVQIRTLGYRSQTEQPEVLWSVTVNVVD